MKKVLIAIGVLAMAASSVFAVPTGQASFSMTQNLFWQDSGFSVSTPAGWYVEIILQQNNVAYNYDNASQAAFDSYLVAGSTGVGFLNPAASYHETGKLSTGAATSSGRASVSWQFTVTTYDNYYASWRVFNNADKAKATKYLVVPTWKQVTVDPAAITANQNISWTTLTTDRAYQKYDMPAIPEPATMALFGLGGLALVIRRKLNKGA